MKGAEQNRWQAACVWLGDGQLSAAAGDLWLCPWSLPAPAVLRGSESSHRGGGWPSGEGTAGCPHSVCQLVQVVQSSVNEHALVSFDFWNNLESVKTSKRWMKRGVWTCSPLEPFSARVCHFSSTIPQTLPHLWSSDENMSYYMHFCRDQHWSVSLENILLLFISKIIVSLIGNTVPTVLPVCN